MIVGGCRLACLGLLFVKNDLRHWTWSKFNIDTVANDRYSMRYCTIEKGSVWKSFFTFHHTLYSVTHVFNWKYLPTELSTCLVGVYLKKIKNIQQTNEIGWWCNCQNLSNISKLCNLSLLWCVSIQCGYTVVYNLYVADSKVDLDSHHIICLYEKITVNLSLVLNKLTKII